MRKNNLGYTELEKKQLVEISKLQEKIKLYEFDKTKDKQENRKLQLALSRKRNSIKNIIEELEIINKNKDYDKIKNIISILKFIKRDDYDE